MSNPLTKEYMEAAIKDTEQALEKCFKKLRVKKDKDRYNAVEKAKKILNENGVIFDLYVLLPSFNKNNKKTEGLFFFSNLHEYFEYDDEEKLKNVDFVREMMSFFIFCFFCRKIGFIFEQQISNEDLQKNLFDSFKESLLVVSNLPEQTSYYKKLKRNSI